MKKNSIQILFTLVVCSLLITAYHFLSKNKIGYVTTAVLLSEYQGMKKANKQFEDEYKLVQNNIENLQKRYQDILFKYENSTGMEKRRLKEEVEEAYENYEKYNTKALSDMETRRRELTVNVLNEINKVIEQYGKENRYKLILGSTDDGSLLYGKQADNITEAILEVLNNTTKKE